MEKTDAATQKKGRLIISCKNDTYLVDQQKIIYCRSDNSYTLMLIEGGEELLASKPVSKIWEELDQDLFVRVSQSCIVNKSCVTRVSRKEKQLHLTDGSVVPFTLKVTDLMKCLTT